MEPGELDVANPRMDFLSTLKDVSWGGAAVQFFPNSHFADISNIGDTHHISIVMWVRASSALLSSTQIPVLDFGYVDAPFTSSQISIGFGAVNARFASRKYNDVLHNCTFAPPGTITETLVCTKSGPPVPGLDFTNAIHFGAVPPWAEEAIGGTISGPGLLPGAHVIGWVFNTDPSNPLGEVGDCGTSQLAPPSGPGVVSHAGDTYTFTFNNVLDIYDGNSIDLPFESQLIQQASAPGIVPDAWNCIMISSDTSIPVSGGIPTFVVDHINHTPLGDIYTTHLDRPPTIQTTSRIFMGVNGVNRSPTTLHFGNFSGTRSTQPFAAGGVLPQRITTGVPFQPGVPPGLSYEGSPTDQVPSTNVCIAGTIPEFNKNGLPYLFSSASINPWPVALAGLGFALPVLTANYIQSGLLEMAAVQIWTNRTINFSEAANYKPFLTSKKRIIHPSTGTASAIFGQPAFSCDGGVSQFLRNKGTAGQLSRDGHIVTFHPGPRVAGQP